MIPKRAALALVTLLFACDQKGPPPDSAAASTAPSALVAPAPPPASPAPSIGVPECDEYFKLAFKCLAKLDPDLRAKAETGIRVNVAGWTALAATPANRAELVQQCTKVAEALKTSPTCRQ